jgi:hypothetical protein
MSSYEYHQILQFLYFEGYADSYELIPKMPKKKQKNQNQFHPEELVQVRKF